jgi:3-deoxy-D-manno-octulosonic-acid transferase
MRRIYAALLYVAIPLASLVVLWRGLAERNYWRGWQQRFGADFRFDTPRLWVHAASVGEVQAASIVIRALRSARPEQRLLLTCTTPTGRERARQQLGDTVDIRYAPYDLPLIVRRVLRAARVSQLLVLETELWPNLLHACAGAQVPVCMVSARVSERTVRRLTLFRGLLSGAALANMSVAAQTDTDARRFAQLGVALAAISVCGNVKFDQPLDDSVRARGSALRVRYASARPVWVAGSTHAGEEVAALAAHAALIEQLGDAWLVLAPRHPQRFAEVAAMLQARELKFVRRSQNAATSDEQLRATPAQVLLLDTLGELTDFYAAADLAFVGGSLVPVGGHNLLEPAALGVATISGTHQFNAPDVARMLTDRHALCLVSTPQELTAAVTRLMGDAVARHALADAARAAVTDNRGALEKILQLLKVRPEPPG